MIPPETDEVRPRLHFEEHALPAPPLSSCRLGFAADSTQPTRAMERHAESEIYRSGWLKLQIL